MLLYVIVYVSEVCVDLQIIDFDCLLVDVMVFN